MFSIFLHTWLFVIISGGSNGIQEANQDRVNPFPTSRISNMCHTKHECLTFAQQSDRIWKHKSISNFPVRSEGRKMRSKRELRNMDSSSSPSFPVAATESKTRLEPYHLETLTGANEQYRVSVRPAFSSVQSTSVVISLDTDVQFKSGKDQLLDNVGVKVNFRSFGSIKERETLLMVRNVSSERGVTSDPNNSSNHYLIDNLHSDTGYIFCFFLLSKDEIASIRGDPTIEEGENKTNSHILVQKNKSILTKQLSQRNQSLNLDGKQASFVTTNSPIPRQSLPPKSNQPPRPRNYAYTSTGELIYLPPSSWNPRSSRTKRENSRRTSNCLEVKTLANFEMILTPYFVMVISLSFLGIFTAVLLIIFLCKSSWVKKKFQIFRDRQKALNIKKGIQSIKGKKELFEGKISTTSDGDAHVQGNSFYNEEYSQIREDSDSTVNISKLYPKTRTYRKDNNSGSSKESKAPPPLCLHMKNTSSQGQFHPRYELPPSSTVEVYGYDSPKRWNKGTESPQSPCPSSCELNDYVPDNSRDNISARLNLDIPHMRYKHSESNKQIGTNGELNCCKRNNTLHTLVTPSVPYYEEAQRHEYPRRIYRPPSYNTCLSIEDNTQFVYNISPTTTPPARVNLKRCDTPSGNEFLLQRSREGSLENLQSKEARKFSLGDVSISGGTLIEVPEGYVIPKVTPKPVSPTVVRIAVHTNSDTFSTTPI